MIPGEYFLRDEPIELNAGRATRRIEVSNRGDRPIQVGSHCHFFEVNRWLSFDRAKAYGMRLNIAAGTAVRFEPGDTLLFGAEGTGLSAASRAAADCEVRVAMTPGADSLNVATASGIALHRLTGWSPAW